MFLLTVSLWLIYGLMVGDLPLILANVCAVTAVLFIVTAKLKFG